MNEAWFTAHYKIWRENRINKIYEIMGNDFFRNSNGLEVGCGFGHVSQILTKKSQTMMTCSEGRQIYLKEIKKNNPHAKVILHNHNKLWSNEFKPNYDFIIHWGLLYHLNNWKQDLNEACKHTKVLFLETIVNTNNITCYIKEKLGYDQALDTKACRPAVREIENQLELNGFNDIKRYDDESLNSYSKEMNHIYDWSKNINGPVSYRRFWIAKKI